MLFSRQVHCPSKRATPTLATVFTLFLAFALTGFGPTQADARCTGKDLRKSLSPDARAMLEQQAAKIPFAQGNHWLATRNGQRIHIIGTQHFGDSRMHSVMRRLRPLIKSADVVFLEQTATQMASHSKNNNSQRQHYLLPKGITLPKLLSKEEWATLSMMAPLLDIPAHIAPHLQPWVYTMHFGGSRCGVRGITSQRGLDARIERYATRNQVPVGGLERTEDGIKAFSSRPLRDQVKYLELTMRSQAENDDHLITLRESYFDGKLAEGRLLSQQLRFNNQGVSRREAIRLIAQLDRALLDRRNKAWLPVILRRKEPVLFIAVGAAHLAGQNGLLSLLQRNGFELQRAKF